MGLDMYACAITEAPARPVDFKAEGAAEIHYWRKHPNLHGWMEQLYRDKGGTDSTFNCVNVQLTAGDLYDLELAIKANVLPETSGFFFGASDGSEVDNDLEFLRKARDALAATSPCITPRGGNTAQAGAAHIAAPACLAPRKTRPARCEPVAAAGR